jgi:uncharacterized membrane protein YvlD (DUF360 family)
MRLLVRIALAVVANAVALIVVALLLDDFEIDATSFLFAVVLFSILSLLLRPILVWAVVRWARPLVGVVGLVTTFGILLITDLFSDGIQIEGAVTWILATVIVWLALVVYEVLSDRLVRAVLHRGPPGAPAA